MSGGSAAALMSVKKGPKESIGLCLMKVFGDSCKGGQRQGQKPEWGRLNSGREGRGWGREQCI